MENEWIVIEVSLPGQYVELAGAVLADLGAGGTVIEDRQLDTFVVPDEELLPEQRYSLKAYFEAVENKSGLQQQIIDILQSLPALGADQFTVTSPRVVKMEDWAENWKQNFSTLRIGTRLVIHPSWEDYQPVADEVAIEIDPGMAFGTGTHGTTLLCLQMIAELLDAQNPPVKMLDVGTGSGILALGAAALGCREILANDIDPLACQVAQENVVKNNFSDRIEISPLPLEELQGTFDLVVANILAEENIRLKAELLGHLRPGGWLVLSGILQEKEQLVRDGFADLPLDALPTRVQDEWICLLYRRRN
ncbi:50S ribosomal protein L11 methyltransferase [Malonomonas rubra]|uniref:50S ribosomal protein L11 methyltransferase n=1 Tax=Malonomonas rubra TaxID=57040 RepID=UPI0026EE365F|nr:50S ribosomal protein L11 methyltransferase [Malonomonas rubra]